MKKILTKLFFIMVILSAQILCALPSYSGGNGSVGTPYLISNATDLTTLASTVNGGNDYHSVYFQQTIGITLSGTWTPIGTNAARFSGNYNGNGFKITGLVITGSADYQGLFGYADGAAISNLGVEGVSITGGNYVGGLAGFVRASTISNCYSTGSVSGISKNGGLIGTTYSNSSLSNCYTTVSVSSTAGIAGGLSGSAYNFISISNCYSRGSASIGAGVQDVGGLIGYLYGDGIEGACAITNCYAAAGVSGDVGSHLGGFIGKVETTAGQGIYAPSNCFWDSDVATAAVGDIGVGPTGSNVANITNESTANMKIQGTFTGWDFASTWEIVATFYPRLQNLRDGSLPVELTSFTSAVSKNGVTLKWSTATEVNNYGFNVERRVVNSTSSWAKIGFVAGHGTSNSTISYSYTDAGIASGSYAYRLKQIDNGGAFKYSQSIQLEVSLTPTVIGLSQNYPNPFNPTTLITFSVANTENAKLVVYNILGQPVVTLFDGVANGQQAYQLRLDASKLSTGVYFYKLETPSRTDVRRMQLLK
jgi:hypothetical protein